MELNLGLTQPVAIIIGAVIGGLSGAVGAWLMRKAEKRKRGDALFSTALGFLGGGSQRRNLGVAAISLYWREFPQHRQLCAEMLVGAAIYLLAESGQENSSHEIYNLHRIMDLLKEIAPRLKNRDCYERIKAEIVRRLSTYEAEPKKGLWVTVQELEKWQLDLQAL